MMTQLSAGEPEIEYLKKYGPAGSSAPVGGFET